MQSLPPQPTKPITGSTIFTRLLVGFGSGALGTLVLGIAVLLTWGIVGQTLSPTDVSVNEFGVVIEQREDHPLFLAIIIMALFLSLLVTSLSYGLLSNVSEPEYRLRSTMMTHIFFGNIVLLLFALPMYFFTNSIFGPAGITASGLLHAALVLIYTVLVMQSLHAPRHFLVQVYGLLLGLAMSGAFLVILINGGNTALVSFLALPVLYAFAGVGSGIAQAIYGWIYETYGVDSLNIQTRFGGDYSEEGKGE